MFGCFLSILITNLVHIIAKKIKNKKIKDFINKEIIKEQIEAGKVFERITKDPIVYLHQDDEVDCCGIIKKEPKLLIYKSVWMWPSDRSYPLIYTFYDTKDKKEINLSFQAIYANIVET